MEIPILRTHAHFVDDLYYPLRHEVILFVASSSSALSMGYWREGNGRTSNSVLFKSRTLLPNRHFVRDPRETNRGRDITVVGQTYKGAWPPNVHKSCIAKPTTVKHALISPETNRQSTIAWRGPSSSAQAGVAM